MYVSNVISDLKIWISVSSVSEKLQACWRSGLDVRPWVTIPTAQCLSQPTFNNRHTVGGLGGFGINTPKKQIRINY